MALVASRPIRTARPAPILLGTAGVGAAVSVTGNAVHAMLPMTICRARCWGRGGSRDRVCRRSRLVLVTHALSILWRFTPYEPRDEIAQRQDDALALAAERLERWDAVAAAIHERGQMLSHPTAKIADACACSTTPNRPGAAPDRSTVRAASRHCGPHPRRRQGRARRAHGRADMPARRCLETFVPAYRTSDTNWVVRRGDECVVGPVFVLRDDHAEVDNLHARLR